RPDHRRAAVRLERVRQGRIDLLRESEARQRCKFRHWQIDRESIQHDLKALLYTCLRNRAAELRNGTLLLLAFTGEIGAREPGRDVEPALLRGRERAAVSSRERGQGQADDHSDPAV